jgi:hypothetical protein
MMDILRSILIEPLTRFYEGILDFLPNLLTSLLILVVGIIISKILKSVFLRIFQALHIDRFSEKSGLMELLKKGGLQETLSEFLSKLVGWITVVIFAIIALRALALPTVENLFSQFLLYLPQVFVASLILVFGHMLGNFFGRAALIASVNAGIRVSGFIGKFVKFTVFILAATMALEQLGIGKETVGIAFAIIFGGVVLALSLSFGLGGRDIAREYLEKKLKDEEKKDDITHL